MMRKKFPHWLINDNGKVNGVVNTENKCLFLLLFWHLQEALSHLSLWTDENP